MPRFPVVFLIAASVAGAAPASDLPSPERVQTLLFEAASAGRTDMIGPLIKAGADVNAYDPRGFTPLILASYNGHLATLEALIAAKADPCKPDAKQGNTAQMGVAFKGYDDIAARLLATNCAVDARNRQGQTALMMAAMFNRTAQVDMLKGKGANPAIADSAGRTAASVAEVQGNPSMAKYVAK